jgi:hypothetical protein
MTFFRFQLGAISSLLSTYSSSSPCYSSSSPPYSSLISLLIPHLLTHLPHLPHLLTLICNRNRVCPGKTAALVNLFLIFTTLISKYKFSNVPGQKLDLWDGSNFSPIFFSLPFLFFLFSFLSFSFSPSLFLLSPPSPFLSLSFLVSLSY